MKINLNEINKEHFLVSSRELNGETVHLVQPQHINCKWTQDNKHFRSSVWSDSGELISAGFPKFVNWGEKPEHFPTPETIDESTVFVEKLDGSLLIVSKYKGKFILRTRGTVNARELDNGHELDVFHRLGFLETLDRVNLRAETWEYSYLFEWVSPLNKIVLNYGKEPDWFLIGIVSHNDYSLWLQDSLNSFARVHAFKRPPHYSFSSFDELLSSVEKWVGKEGICVYSNCGQTIHKTKSLWYLTRHRLKSELNSLEKAVDFWLINLRPKFDDFKEMICDIDFELWDGELEKNALKICEASDGVTKKLAEMNSFIQEIKSLPTRKEQALKIVQNYGAAKETGFLFKLLDSKPLEDKDVKELMMRALAPK